MTLNVPSIDFGPIRPREQTQTTLLLTNTTQLEASWILERKHQDSQVHRKHDKMKAWLTVHSVHEVTPYKQSVLLLRSQLNPAGVSCLPWPLAMWTCSLSHIPASCLKLSWN